MGIRTPFDDEHDRADDDQPTRGGLGPIERLDQDLRAAAKLLTPDDARWAVDRYYQIQNERIRAAAQIRSEDKTQEPNRLLQFMLKQFGTLEDDIRKALDDYSESQLAGRWAKSVVGIGPVIAAGLLAHIDIERVNSAGQVWRFAGLDPSVKWLGQAGAKVAVDMALQEEYPEIEPDEVITEGEIDQLLLDAQQRAAVLAEGEVATLARRYRLPVGLIYRNASNEHGQVTLQTVLEAFPDLMHGEDVEEALPVHGRKGGLTYAQVVAVARATNRSTASLYRLSTNEHGIVTRESLIKALAKRPWNASLKVLTAFKAGESFVKTQNRPRDVYGHVFADRKALEQDRNQRGDFADQAAAVLASKNIGKQTEAYKWYSEGKLPPAHIHARARRYAVKLFLSHFYEVSFEIHHGRPPADPYPLAILGHKDRFLPPNWHDGQIVLDEPDGKTA